MKSLFCPCAPTRNCVLSGKSSSFSTKKAQLSRSPMKKKLMDGAAKQTVEDLAFIPKGPIVRHLQEKGIPFVDTGMEVVRTEGGALGGAVRATYCSADEEGRQVSQKYICMEGGALENMYDANIQIAELNALNAALAVIRWKRSCGYYGPSDRQRGVSYANMVYSLSGDCLHHEKTNTQAV